MSTPRPWARGLALIAVLAVAGSLLAASPAGASGPPVVITPNTLLDSTAPGPALTLREAFRDAWTIGSSAPSVVTIRLAAGQTYRLDNCSVGPVLQVDTEESTILLDGRGATIEQTCPGKSVIRTLGSGNHMFSRVTVAGGGAGGIDFVGSSLFVIDSTVRNNSTSGSGGGISVVGDLHVLRSTVRNNTAAVSGGGISSGSDQNHVTVTNSTVSNNAALGPANLGGGGGVDSKGTLELNRSTILLNAANDGNGGGISSTGPVTVTESTVARNSARAGGGVQQLTFDPMSIVNSTFSGNVAQTSGGAILSLTSLTMNAVTFQANGAGADGAHIWHASLGGGSITNSVFGTSVGPSPCSLGGDPASGNFDKGDSCDFDPATNIVNGGDPSLGPLAANGGLTLTHLPSSRSPLVNQVRAVAACPFKDQRGVVRPQGGVCDIGAVER